MHTLSFVSLLSPVVVAPHAQDLNHADKDVQEVQLETDTLVDNVASHDPPLSQPSMVQDLLDIVQGEATEHGQATIQPDALRPHQ